MVYSRLLSVHLLLRCADVQFKIIKGYKKFADDSGFEPKSSGVSGDHSINCATTSAPPGR